MSKSKNYGVVSSMDQAKALVDKLMEDDKPIGFDVETGYIGTDREKGSLAVAWPNQFISGFSITNGSGWARYVPVAHDLGENLPEAETWELFKEPLEKLFTIAHHLKFEGENLQALERKGRGPNIDLYAGKGAHDTMLDAYVLAHWPVNGLKDLVDLIFQHKMVHIKDLFPDLTEKQLKCLRFNVLELSPEVVAYGCEDAAWTFALYEKISALAQAERPFMQKLEHQITEIVQDIQEYGVLVDWESMEKSRTKVPTFISQMEKAVKTGLSEMAGRDLGDLNLNSPQKMKQVLYEELGLSTTRYTKGADKMPAGTPEWKKMSTDANALEGLASDNPPIKKLLELREVKNMSKRHDNWLEKYPRGWDNRAHPSYGQTIVPTGRFAASDPSIQQCPKGWKWTTRLDVTTESLLAASENAGKKWEEIIEEDDINSYWDGNFREFIIPAEGYYFLTYDYSQIELRVLTGESGEPMLRDAFENDRDVHTLTAAMMLGKPVDQIDKNVDRPIGKSLADSERVLTPNGKVAIRDLKIGDSVCHPSGLDSTVEEIHLQGERPIYRVETVDGGHMRVDEEHIWQTQRGLLTTLELRPGDVLPSMKPWAGFDSKLPIDPYTLGVLLGDASFSTHGVVLCVAQGEEKILEQIVLPEGVTAKPQSVKNKHTEYRLSTNHVGTRNPLRRALARMELAGKKDQNKFVPIAYKTASVEQRYALLRGLMDTDGYAASKHVGEFVTVSWQLSLDVRELVWSLGGRAKWTRKNTSWWHNGEHKTGEAYRIYISLPEPMFTLDRKNARTSPREVMRTIGKIVPNGTEEARCIKVSNPDGLFIAGDYMVTHNTMNFALLYQMGAKSLAERLGLTLSRAKELYKEYFKQFSSVRTWMEKVQREGMIRGYAETRFGRRITVWELKSDNVGVRSKGERILINAPIQGGAADYMKIAKVRVAKDLKKRGWWKKDCTIIMNQHDSLTFEVSEDLDPAEVRAAIEKCVVFPVPGFPKIVADWELGYSWGGSKAWKDGMVPVRDAQGHWSLVKGEVVPEPYLESEETTPVDSKDVADSVCVRSNFDVSGNEMERGSGEVETSSGTSLVSGESESLFEEAAERTLIVTVTDMPSKEGFQQFVELIRSRPGNDVIKLVTPEGEVQLPMGHGIGPEDQPLVSMALGGARVGWAVESVDVDNLVTGMVL